MYTEKIERVKGDLNFNSINVFINCKASNKIILLNLINLIMIHSRQLQNPYHLFKKI